ncbi:MAG: CHAT domain-containing protein [Symploca sp. SIO2E9]|nr:CHAT domain-containing protein [Symploca sp. SIO2E9]
MKPTQPILSLLLGLGISFTPVTVPLITQRSWAQTQNLQEEAQGLIDQAVQWTRQGQPQKAIATFQRALAIARQIKSREIEAAALLGIGSNYSNIRQHQQALDIYNQALPIFRKLGNRFSEALILHLIGVAYNNLGQPQQALQFYNQALLIHRELDDRSEEAKTLNSIGVAYNNLGQPQQALQFYNQALLIHRELDDRSEEAETLNSIGIVYRKLGQFQQALQFYNRAWQIFREIADRSGEAWTITNIGVVYDRLGQPQQAIQFYNQALSIYREVSNRSGEATTIINLGSAYLNLGKLQQALQFYNQALPIFQEVNNRSKEAITLSNIGAVYRKLGQPQQSLQFYNQALLIFKEIGDSLEKFTTLNNIGTVYLSLKQPQRALEFYNQVLPILKEVGDRSQEAVTLSNIGAVYRTLEQPQQALEYYNQALPIRREVGDRSQEAVTLNNIGFVYRDTNQPAKAINNFEESVKITIEMRRGLQQEHREKFFNNKQGPAIALISLLIDQNKIERAFEWVNLATTFELADYTRLIDAKVTNPQAQQAINQWNQKNQRLEFLRQQLEDDFSEEKSRQIRELETQVNQLAEEITKKYPEVAELFETTPEDTAKLKASIPAGTVVIQPVLLNNSIAIFILAKDKPTTVKKVPIEPAQFNDLIVNYRKKLQDRKATGYRTTSGELYDLLIRPIEDQIQALSPKQIAIIATDKLRYIPFETLYDQKTKQFLIEKQYPINYFTRLSINSLQNLRVEDSVPQPRPVLGLGNPNPNEPYNLPDSEAEVQSLPKIIPGSEAYIRNDATLERFKQEALRFRFLHLATHGCFEKDGCCLGEKHECEGVRQLDMLANTLLFAGPNFDIANAALLGLQNTELITLSACQTALREDSNGEEIAGIAYLFERAGAKSVMASLWNAEDNTTKDIMVQFYGNLNQGMSKGEALRQAKLSQIQRHPFFWSPFILIGDAR